MKDERQRGRVVNLQNRRFDCMPIRIFSHPSFPSSSVQRVEATLGFSGPFIFRFGNRYLSLQFRKQQSQLSLNHLMCLGQFQVLIKVVYQLRIHQRSHFKLFHQRIFPKQLSDS